MALIKIRWSYFPAITALIKKVAMTLIISKAVGHCAVLSATCMEGGIREPMIAWWPGKIKAGSTSDYTGAFWDLLPRLPSWPGSRNPKELMVFQLFLFYWRRKMHLCIPGCIGSFMSRVENRPCVWVNGKALS